jgi:hypothetical protein
MTNATEKHDKFSVKHDKYDSAYKEGTFSRTFSKEPTTTTAQADVRSQAAETRPVAAVADSRFEERLNEARPAFRRIEEQLGQGISGKTRAELQRTIEAQGFGIPQLAYAFGRYGQGLKTVGGLINFAAVLNEHARAIEKWPCLVCYGEGTIVAPGSPFEGRLPCTCPEGKKQESREVFEGIEEYRKDPANYCGLCRNTGKQLGMWSTEDDFCEKCAKGKQLAREREAAERKRQTLIQAGKCPECSGEGRIQATDRTTGCLWCRGTGLAKQPVGSCSNCWGRKVDWMDEPCNRCAEMPKHRHVA